MQPYSLSLPSAPSPSISPSLFLPLCLCLARTLTHRSTKSDWQMAKLMRRGNQYSPNRRRLQQKGIIPNVIVVVILVIVYVCVCVVGCVSQLLLLLSQLSFAFICIVSFSFGFICHCVLPPLLLIRLHWDNIERGGRGSGALGQWRARWHFYGHSARQLLCRIISTKWRHMQSKQISSAS